MLPAAHRMRSAADFTQTTRRGLRASRGSVVVYLLAEPGPRADERVLVGLTVGRSVGNAVTRHRASRRLRALMADALPDLPSGARVVVRALPGAAQSSELGRDLRAALQTVLARADAGEARAHVGGRS